MGATFNLSPRWQLKAGLGIYHAKWQTIIGRQVSTKLGPVPYVSASPNQAFEGLNVRKDTLYILDQNKFKRFSGEEIYSLENLATFNNQMNGLSIPIGFSYKLIGSGPFSVRAQLESRLMLERKRDILRYNENYAIYLREHKRYSFLRLQSMQVDAGLSLNYRIKRFTLSATSSYQKDVYNREKSTDISSVGLCRFTLGIGVNYHL